MPESEPQNQDLERIQEITSELNQEGIVVVETNDSFLGRIGKSFSEKIIPVGKRIALPVSAVILAVAAACADGESEQKITLTLSPSETPIPTFTSEPTLTVTPESTPTLTPETLAPPETLELGIPDLIAIKYSVRFVDITDKVTDSYWLWECGDPRITDNVVEKRDHEIYYTVNGKRNYHLILDRNKTFFWGGQELTDVGLLLYSEISCNGEDAFYRGELVEDENFATVLIDFPDATKVIFKDRKMRIIMSELTDDGKKLLLSFSVDGESTRGTYLIDLDSWEIQLHLDEASFVRSFSENNDRLYMEFGWSNSYVVDLLTGEKLFIQWPRDLTPGVHTASPDLNFIARDLALFPSNRTEEGQYGIVVHTPSGQFRISSPHRTLQPKSVENDGTIYTERGEVFKFENGTYVLSETSDGNPLDVNIVRIE